MANLPQSTATQRRRRRSAATAVLPVARNAEDLGARVPFRRTPRAGDVRLVVAAAGALLDVSIPLLRGALRERQELWVKDRVLGLRIAQDDVVDTAEVRRSLS